MQHGAKSATIPAMKERPIKVLCIGRYSRFWSRRGLPATSRMQHRRAAKSERIQ
jgi:hypothetical protein